MEHMSVREFPLAPYGLRLGTRQEGLRVRGDLVQALEELPERGVLVVDVSGLEVLSGSFADEALVEAVAWLTERGGPGRYLVVRASGAEEVEDLGARLGQRKLALLALLSEGPRALGHLPPYLAQALDLVHQQGAITSQELACELGVSVQGAAVRLAALARLRLVHPEPEARAMGGRQNRAVSLLPQLASPPA
ncbi:MAG: hypothetical protein R6U88_05395 [Candidatus Bipolaricaulota bacterium]